MKNLLAKESKSKRKAPTINDVLGDEAITYQKLKKHIKD